MTATSEAMDHLAKAQEFLAAATTSASEGQPSAAAELRRAGAAGAACANDLDRLLRIKNLSQYLAVAVSATDAAKALDRAGKIVAAAERLLLG